ncbi:MAG TPA: hypothetical protein VK989_20750 [Polyangia bacterium]|nr:hypothetical protein [Polyangia bacterium]
MFRRTRAWVLALALSWIDVACLDAGPTPRGRQLLASRAEDHVELLDGAVGLPRRIFVSFTEPGPFGVPTRQLATVDDPGPTGGATPLRVLIDHVAQAPVACSVAGCLVPVDAQGRLYVDQQTFSPSTNVPGGTDERDDLVVVDPVTGAQQHLGPVEFVEISADRARVVYQPENATPLPPPVVRELSGAEIALPGGESATFVGNDLFFVSDDGHLSRLAASSGTVEALASQVGSFEAFATQRGFLLQLNKTNPAGDATFESSLFDVSTLTETLLPEASAAAQAFIPSPSGRYVGTMSAPELAQDSMFRFTVFDRDTAQQTLATEPAMNVPSLAWRPQHDELWFVMNQANADAFWRWRPGAAPEEIGPGDPPSQPPLATALGQELPLLSQPTFTPDGAFLFVADGFFQDRQPVALRSADDVTAAPYSLTPTGTGLSGVWPLAAGRLLAEDWITDVMRNDIYLVDPAARTSRPLASTGHVVATGRDRFLALLHWVAEGAAGDLTSIDYATGTQTLIAQNVSGVAVDASADPDDALAPGTRVAYLVHDRIASPYDGLWVLELP